MVPNKQWMLQKFTKYNSKYFGGQLPTPRLEVNRLRAAWGNYYADVRYDGHRRIYYIPKDYGVLTLTSAYDRSEKSVIETLLHEMVHEYVYLIMKVNPRNEHGSEFMSVAKPIIADGWNITEAERITATDRLIDDDEESGTSEQGHPSIVCICSPHPKCNVPIWFFKIEDGNMNKAVQQIRSYGGSNPKFYYCYSNGIYMDKENTGQLDGFGGNNFSEICQKLSQYYGEPIEVFKNLKKMSGKSHYFSGGRSQSNSIIQKNAPE